MLYRKWMTFWLELPLSYFTDISLPELNMSSICTNNTSECFTVLWVQSCPINMVKNFIHLFYKFCSSSSNGLSLPLLNIGLSQWFPSVVVLSTLDQFVTILFKSAVYLVCGRPPALIASCLGLQSIILLVNFSLLIRTICPAHPTSD